MAVEIPETTKMTARSMRKGEMKTRVMGTNDDAALEEAGERKEEKNKGLK
jgi:hypothetical protein